MLLTLSVCVSDELSVCVSDELSVCVSDELSVCVPDELSVCVFPIETDLLDVSDVVFETVLVLEYCFELLKDVEDDSLEPILIEEFEVLVFVTCTEL